MKTTTLIVDKCVAAGRLAAMDSDDIAPPPRGTDPVTLAARQDLDPLSVAELDVRIAALDAEIVRTRARRERAVNHRESADAIFRS